MLLASKESTPSSSAPAAFGLFPFTFSFFPMGSQANVLWSLCVVQLEQSLNWFLLFLCLFLLLLLAVLCCAVLCYVVLLYFLPVPVMRATCYALMWCFLSRLMRLA